MTLEAIISAIKLPILINTNQQTQLVDAYNKWMDYKKAHFALAGYKLVDQDEQAITSMILLKMARLIIFMLTTNFRL